MGPESERGELPSRPRFSWDSRNVPWTDGVGDQEGYEKAVLRWERFHDNLDEGNSNKIAKKNRGIVLLSNLYGRAADLCDGVADEVMEAENGAELIIAKLVRRDALSAVALVYEELSSLLNTRRRAHETHKSFELRFSAQLSRFNSIGTDVALPESIAALCMLRNADVDSAQRIAVLSAASPRDQGMTPRSSISQCLGAVKYESIATVLRQCEAVAEPTKQRMDAYAGDLTNMPAPRWHGEGAGDRRMMPQRHDGYGRPSKFRRPGYIDIPSAKRILPCARCKRYGHWYSEHNPDGSLPSHVRSEAGPIVDTTSGGLRGRDEIRSVPATPPPPPPAAEGQKESDKTNQNQRPATTNNERSSDKPRSITFHMSTVRDGENPRQDEALVMPTDAGETGELGPMLDCGAPYSAIGFKELCEMGPRIAPCWDGSLLPLPAQFANHTKWQYGSGTHASPTRDILGSIMLTAEVDDTKAHIRHLVLEGSSQWVIGCNVTSRCNILMMSGQRLEVPTDGGDRVFVPIVQHAFHLYLLAKWFTRNHDDGDKLWALAAQGVTTQWSNVKRIVDRVHEHVCGHAAFSDIRTLLTRNGLWSDEVSNYLAAKMTECRACRATSRPQPSRKVSLSLFSRHFNDVVCIDHVHFEGTVCMHVMDARTRYSAGTACEGLTMDEATRVFDTIWLSPFWTPREIQGDAAFGKGAFGKMMSDRGIHWRPTPPGRHSRLVLESKHSILRAIYLRIMHQNVDKRTAAGRAFAISNDLYGSAVMSAYELAHGFTRPLSETPQLLPQSVIKAQECLEAKRKLARILRSKATHDRCPQPGDMVEPYVKRQNDKRGRWLSARTVLSFDRAAWSVMLPGSADKTMTVAVEDVRPAVLNCEEDFARAVREANDQLDFEVDELLAETQGTATTDVQKGEAEAPRNAGEGSVAGENKMTQFTPDYSSDGGPAPGRRIEVLWPMDGVYYPGRIDSISNGMTRVIYDDGDEENLQLNGETWRFCTAVTLPATRQSALPDVLKDMLEVFGNKSFMRHEAVRFPQFALTSAYDREEHDFKRTVKMTAIAKVPKNANVITSHVLYKIKVGDEHDLTLKARIAPHGNEDAFKADMKSDCSQCPPYGVRMLLSFAALQGWRLSKIDVKAAFLQTGRAERDVFVVPPRESNDRGKVVWLLLAAAYGLINANAKWQVHSDALLMQIGFVRAALCPQLFIRRNRQGNTEVMLAKIVDDILITGPVEHVDDVIRQIDERYPLGTIGHGPGHLRFFGLNLCQQDDMSVTIDGDDKLNALGCCPVTRLRRRQVDSRLNSIEQRAFTSVNCSIGWLGITCSLFCSEFSSRMQQEAPRATVRTLMAQTAGLRQLQKLGTMQRFPRAPKGVALEPRLVVFSDAGRSTDAGQLASLTGLLLGDVRRGTTFHVMAWTSHKARRPVRSTAAAEILAAGEAIDDGKMFACTMSDIYGMEIPLVIAIDTKDLYSSLSSQRNAQDKSVRADVNVIRYEFELGLVSAIAWIPGKCNLADPGTKPDSPLRDALQITLFDGVLQMDFEGMMTTSATRPLG